MIDSAIVQIEWDFSKQEGVHETTQQRDTEGGGDDVQDAQEGQHKDATITTRRAQKPVSISKKIVDRCCIPCVILPPSSFQQ